MSKQSNRSLPSSSGQNRSKSCAISLLAQNPFRSVTWRAMSAHLRFPRAIAWLAWRRTVPCAGPAVPLVVVAPGKQVVYALRDYTARQGLCLAGAPFQEPLAGNQRQQRVCLGNAIGNTYQPLST